MLSGLQVQVLLFHTLVSSEIESLLAISRVLYDWTVLDWILSFDKESSRRRLVDAYFPWELNLKLLAFSADMSRNDNTDNWANIVCSGCLMQCAYFACWNCTTMRWYFDAVVDCYLICDSRWRWMQEQMLQLASDLLITMFLLVDLHILQHSDGS